MRSAPFGTQLLYRSSISGGGSGPWNDENVASRIDTRCSDGVRPIGGEELFRVGRFRFLRLKGKSLHGVSEKIAD